MCISIPLRRIVNVNDLDAVYIDPADDREWGLVHFDITVVPVFRIREAARFDKLYIRFGVEGR